MIDRTKVFIAGVAAIAVVGIGVWLWPTKEQTPPPREQPTYEQALSAMSRSLDRVNSVCLDGIRNSAFFVHFSETDYPDHTNLFRGWYLVENVEFYKTSNNTWFITEIPDNKFTKVFPDVTGLQCKEKNLPGT